MNDTSPRIHSRRARYVRGLRDDADMIFGIFLIVAAILFPGLMRFIIMLFGFAVIAGVFYLATN